MLDFLKKIKISMMGSSVVTIVIGLVLLLRPLGATEAVCSMVGMFLLILGAFGLLNRFVFHSGAANSIELGINMIETIAGLYILWNPGSIIKFIFLIFAVILLVHGFHDMDTAMQMKRSGYDRWWGSFVIAVLTILLGVIALTKPFESTALLLRVIGASLLFDGVTDLLIVHKTSKVLKNAREKAEPIDVDAKIK